MPHTDEDLEPTVTDLYIGRVASEALKEGFWLTIRKQTLGLGVQNTQLLIEAHEPYKAKTLSGIAENVEKLEAAEREIIMVYAQMRAVILIERAKDMVKRNG